MKRTGADTGESDLLFSRHQKGKGAVKTTQRSLTLMRRRGYICDIAERRVPRVNITKDLFGFADIVCIREDGDIIFVQTTVYSHFAERVRKCQNFKGYPWVNIEVHGWHKKEGTWWCRIAEHRRGWATWEIIQNGNL